MKLISTFTQRRSMTYFYYEGSLYKTQTNIMNRDAWSFTGNKQPKSCRPLVSCMHKPGWQETHTFRKSLKNSTALIIIIGDSIAASLRRYGHVWRNYFKDVLLLGISGDRVENVSWRARDISLPHITLFVIIHCDTDNVDQNKTKDVAVGIMEIAKTL